MKTKIYIIRHGESIGNSLRVCLGHTDLDLTDMGRSQAEATAEELKTVKFDKIYSSDLIRAYNTALPHAKMRGMDIITDARLRELYLGEWENMSIKDIIDGYGELYTVDWCLHFGTFTPPAGESVPDLAKRMNDAILNIGRENLGSTVLLATHAGAIRTFWGLISGVPREELCERVPFASNASYSIVEYDRESDRLLPIEYSSDGHLEGMFTTWKD